MSKRYIKMVREFNQWRVNFVPAADAGYPAQLGCALDKVVTMAERYEIVRNLNPRQFAELYARNLAGEGVFDDLVDELAANVQIEARGGISRASC